LCTRAVGALGHYLEEDGIATTAISLVREHTEVIVPPRALWVPFPLGRPFGSPNEPEFQRRVLNAALELLERPDGPILEDFPDDGPSGAEEDGAWACALPLPSTEEPANDAEALQAEVSRLRPWYEEAIKKHGRTAVGVTGLGVDEIPELAGMLTGAALDEEIEVPSGAETAMPLLLRFAADDLKTYYMEAAAAQPSASTPSVEDMNRWLFGQTRLGEMLYRARDTLAASDDDGLKAVARAMVPVAYANRPTLD
jgi:hypothetical protein